MKWCVLQSEFQYESNERDRLFGAVTVFDTKEEAIKFVEHVIRKEWYTDISVRSKETGEYDGETVPLANCKGYHSDPLIKYSEVYYSEDGMEAWVHDEGRCCYRICAKPMNEDGVRTPMTI